MTEKFRIEHLAELDHEGHAFVAEQWQLHDAEHGESFERQSFVLVARTNWGRVVGTATGWTGMTMAYLSELIVDHQNRRHGIGSQLLTAFEALAQGAGIIRLALRTEKDGLAQVFYARHGWWVEAELSDWYNGRTYVHMRKDVGS